MKKFFSVFIAFTMILSSFVAFAEETTTTPNLQFSDVEKNSVIGVAVENLVANDIINGYPDGTFKPNGDITRAEFAAVIARFKGIGNNLAEDAVTGFSDLDSDDSYKWARPYVKAAVDSGVINGFEDGTFRAAEYVTYEQAVKMIICAINYHAKANSELLKIRMNNENVRWSAGYIAVANQIGVSKNAVVADVNIPANRGLVAILTNNAFSAPKVNVTTDNKGNVSFSTGGGGSVVGDREDIKDTVKGIVTATVYTSLDSQESNLKYGEIKIDDKVYDVEQDYYEKLDLLDLIGRRVEARISKREGEITSITDKTNANDILELKEEKLIRPFEKSEIKYFDYQYKEKSEDVEGFKFIYNGKYIPGATFDMFDIEGDGDVENSGETESAEGSESTEGGETTEGGENTEGGETTEGSGEAEDSTNKIKRYPFTNGTVEVIDDRSSKIVKITSYDVFVVKSFAKNKKEITFRYNKKYKGEDSYVFSDRRSEHPVIYLDGREKVFDDLTSLDVSGYSIINLMESPEDFPGETAKIMHIRSKSTAERKGKIVESLGRDGREVDIADSIYYLTNDYANYEPQKTGDEEKHPLERGENCTFYLDYTGQIAAINYSLATSGKEYKYGYLILFVQSDDTYLVRFIDENGDLKDKISLKNYIELDGKNTSVDSVASVLADSAEIANAGYNLQVEGDKNWNATPLGSDSYAQPIRYHYESGQIVGIDTVLDGDGNPDRVSPVDMLKCQIGLKNGKTNVNTAMADTYGIDSKTKILYVPDARNDVDAYALLTRQDAFEVKNERYIEAYGPTNTAEFIIVYQTNPMHEFRSNQNYIMVSEVNMSERTIKGYGKEPQKAVAKISRTVWDSSRYRTDVDPKCVALEDIEKGDIIQYVIDRAKNGTEKIIAIRRIYDASNPAQAVPVNTSKAAQSQRRISDKLGNSYFRAAYGSFIDDINNRLEYNQLEFTWYIKADVDSLPKNESNSDYNYVFDLSNTPLIVFDGTNVEVLKPDADNSQKNLIEENIKTMGNTNPSEVMLVIPSLNQEEAPSCMFIFNYTPGSDESEENTEEQTE